MHTELQTRRPRGRLSREDQRRLGDVLQRVYDDVLKQGVPDRFKTLIDELGRNEGPGEESLEASEHDLRSLDSEDTHEVHARSSDKSKDETR